MPVDVLTAWNGDFELGSPPPVDKPDLIRNADIRNVDDAADDPAPHGGSEMCRFEFERQAVNYIRPEIRFDNLPVTVGKSYTFEFWFHPAWVTGINSGGEWHTWDMTVLINSGSGTTEVLRIAGADLVDGWTQYTCPAVVPTSSTVDIFVKGDEIAADPFTTYWGFVDDCEFWEGGVAITRALRDALVLDLQDIDGTGGFVTTLVEVGVEPKDVDKIVSPSVYLAPAETGEAEPLTIANVMDGVQRYTVQSYVRSATPHADAQDLLDDIRNAVERSTSNLHQRADVLLSMVTGWSEVLTWGDIANQWGLIEVTVTVKYSYTVGSA